MKQTTTRIITGIIILAIGIGALLSALNLIPFWAWFGTWWPLLVIIGGVFVLLGDFRRNYIWGSAILLVGVLLQLKSLDVLDFNLFSLIVPVLLIAAGLSVLLHSKVQSSIKSNSHDFDDISVIFSGSDSKNQSKKYKGGRITSIFGGAVLDLRDATIEKEATLDVFVVCGGVEIKVPRDWRVIVKAAPIAGGIENKSEGNDNDKAPTLIVTGAVALAGVEIKT